MRNFSWNCFAVTGSIDAYLLFKDTEMLSEDREEKNGQEQKEKSKA
ncbi:YqzL family protein [Melghirimyces profundicolus]|nr:YqzL family protein [Melghirimyces profundicolus]